MFIVLLRFSRNQNQASQFAAGHQEWIQRGIADGVFLVVGSLQPAMGGAILAHNTSRDGLQRRVAEDPFVAADVVSPEILEIAPAHTDERFAFLSPNG
jgi:uncharacterized protein YciI